MRPFVNEKGPRCPIVVRRRVVGLLVYPVVEGLFRLVGVGRLHVFPIRRPNLSYQERRGGPSFANVFQVRNNCLTRRNGQGPFYNVIRQVVVGRHLLVFIGPCFVVLICRYVDGRDIVRFDVCLLRPTLNRVVFMYALSNRARVSVAYQDGRRVTSHAFCFKGCVPICRANPCVSAMGGAHAVSSPCLPTVLGRANGAVLIAKVGLANCRVNEPKYRFHSFVRNERLVVDSCPASVFLHFTRSVIFRYVVVLICLIPEIRRGLSDCLPLFVCPNRRRVFVFNRRRRVPLNHVLWFCRLGVLQVILRIVVGDVGAFNRFVRSVRLAIGNLCPCVPIFVLSCTLSLA